MSSNAGFTQGLSDMLNAADFVDERDPHWYHEWSEREGKFEELVSRACELGWEGK
jgi:hypothetical protein